MLKKINSIFGKISYHLIPISILLIISTIMIASWFRYGLMYGGGDVGLPTYDPARLLSIIKNVWWEAHAPGFPYPSGLTAIPLYFILSILQTTGLSEVATQALLFLLLFFLSGFGMYVLFFEVSSKKSRTLSLLAAIFYVLNPYTVIQIWHRFVHTSFFLAALMPIFTFIYIKIIRTNNYFWFATFLFVSIIFSYVYGSLPFMVVIWVPILIYSFWDCIEKWNLRNLIVNIKVFTLVFVSWIVINIWWLYPFWTTGPTLFAQIHSIYASISTLLSLSNQSSMVTVIRGINSFYTFGDYAWVSGYDNFLMQIISWTFPLVTLAGIYTILADKKKAFYIWISLFLIAIFVSKGTAAPFGHPFLLAFSKSFLLGAFRNPFEKFGIVIPFASAFIFPIGIEWLYFKLKGISIGKKILPVIIIVILLLLEFVIYPWPMWLGKIFGSKLQPAFVNVPKDYKRADAWIKNEKKPGRIIHLPFIKGDAVTYTWENGYNGVEPSPLLFAVPSVANGFGLDQLDYSLGSINTVFSPENFDEKKVADVLSSLDIRYVVLHKDIDWRARVLVDPTIVENVLSKIDYLKKKQTFGNLTIYEIDENLFTAKFFTANVGDVLTGGSRGFSFWPEIYSDKNWPVFFTTPANGNEDKLALQNGLNFSMTPTQIIETPTSPLAYKENALAELPRPRFLPSSPFYILILIKEKIQFLSSPALDKHFVELEQAGKRLSEAHILKARGDTKLADHVLDNYIKKFNKAVEIINQRQMGALVSNIEKLMLKTILARHEIVIKELGAQKVLENSKIKLSELGFSPYYELKEELGMSKYGRKIYRFEVQKEGVYEILLKNPQSKSLYSGGLESVAFQIDDEVRMFSTTPKKEFLSLGEIKLTKGRHEISYNMIDSVNLAPKINSPEWQTAGAVTQIKDTSGEPSFEFYTSKTDDSSLSFKIKDFNKDNLYRIDFEYWIKNGQGPILQVMQDSDWDVKGKRYLAIDKLYDKNNYSFYWNSASIFFEPRSNTTEAIININGEQWNNCQAVLADWDECQKQEIRKAYNRDSDFVVKNISVKRLLINDLYLKSADVHKSPTEITKNLEIREISPSFYEGTLSLNEPTSLIFLATFHPEWKVSLAKDKKTEVISEDNHFLVNGYGNLWYLDKPSGEYGVKVEFLPQKRFYKGIIFSVLGGGVIAVAAGVVLKSMRRKKNND